MISPETCAQIRRYFYAEHWKIGTIAREFGVHPDTVRRAIESERFHPQAVRCCLTDPYLGFIRQTLDQYPRLRATRIYQMIRERGYQGGIRQLRRAVANLRPARTDRFLRLHMFPAEQAQADWAHFGEVAVGRARRRLSCFAITLSYSRALYLEFFFAQTLENFLRGHVHAFQAWSGISADVGDSFDPYVSSAQQPNGLLVLSHPTSRSQVSQLDRVSTHRTLASRGRTAPRRLSSTLDTTWG